MRVHAITLLVTCTAFVFACGETDQIGVSADAAQASPGVDGGVSSEVTEPDDAAEPRTLRALINVMTLPWEVSEGVARGFNLDGLDSDGTGDEGCGVVDYVSPDGRSGIDNQMARLTPLFEPAGLGQTFEYLEQSIKDSGFFHLLEIRNVDSLIDDDEVEFIYEVGGGSGLMDSKGELVPFQTMCVQNDSPHLIASSASITDGVLTARFDELVFLFSMFQRIYPFVFQDMHLTVRITEDGFLEDGVIGGTLAMSNLLQLVNKGAQNTGGLLEPMQALLDGLADMPGDDGPCAALSAALDFGAIPVFFYPPESNCDPCGNDTCEYFESCETCLNDCCPGCGNGECDVYPTRQHQVAVTESGFEPASVDILVGDTVMWTNGLEGPMNLVCDDFFDVENVASGTKMFRVATASGSFTCRVYEHPGQTLVLSVEDNHSESCQSCPGDCGECE